VRATLSRRIVAEAAIVLAGCLLLGWRSRSRWC
jgi:hypothetical protein